MCVDFDGNWKAAKEDISVFKVCRLEGRELRSAWEPDARGRQYSRGREGSDVVYRAGAALHSSAPGIYLFSSEAGARSYVSEYPWRKDLVIIDGTIPEGSRIRVGTVMGDMPTINSQTFIVGKPI